MASQATLARSKKESASRGAIMPNGQFRQTWIQLQLCVAMYIIWVTPVRVGFNLPAEGLTFWFEGMIDLFFYADLALNFFTAFEDSASGAVITDRRAIARRYLRGWFTVDFLATLPVDYIIRAVEGTWMCSLRGDCSWTVFASGGSGVPHAVSAIELLRVLRVARILWILKHFRTMRLATLLGGLMDDLYMLRPLIRILELLVVLSYLGHVCGCFFYLVSTPQYQTPVEASLVASGQLKTWVDNAFGGHAFVMLPTNTTAPSPNVPPAHNTAMDPSTRQWYSCPGFGYEMVACQTCEAPRLRCKSVFTLKYRYTTSVYWAYTTMTTVGYGDISAITVAEKAWAIVTMVISGFFFSFTVGNMAQIVSKLDTRTTAVNERLETVTTFLKDTDLPRHLGKRVIAFFKKQAVKPYDRQAVLAQLPFELRSKILRQLYAGAIQAVPLLKGMADDAIFLTDVCIRLQAYNCSAQTFVYQRGESSADVFILMRGDLQVLDSDQSTLLIAVPEGTVFGEGTVLRHLEGFTRAKRTENVWCATPCEMLRIAAEDMQDLLDQYPPLLETLRKLNHARIRKMHALRAPGNGATVAAAASAAPATTAAAKGGGDGDNGALQGLRMVALCGQRRVTADGEPAPPARPQGGRLKGAPLLLDVGEPTTPSAPGEADALLASDPMHGLRAHGWRAPAARLSPAWHADRGTAVGGAVERRPSEGSGEAQGDGSGGEAPGSRDADSSLADAVFSTPSARAAGGGGGGRRAHGAAGPAARQRSRAPRQAGAAEAGDGRACDVGALQAEVAELRQLLLRQQQCVVGAMEAQRQ